MTSLDVRVTDEIADAAPRLDAAPVGYAAIITNILPADVRGEGGVSADELERRLLEMGFVEGARVEVLHTGLIGGDPIAVRLNDSRVALRKREARAIVLTAVPA